MAESREKKDGSAQKKEVTRGTQDELEILGLVLAQLPILRQQVLEKLRSAKERQAKREKEATARKAD